MSLPPRVEVERVAGLPTLLPFDGPVADAQIASVTAMAVAPDGTVYVADRASLRRVFQGVMTTVAGVGDRPGALDGPAAAARFSAVLRGLAVATDGTVYIADSDNHTIRALSPSGDVRTVAGLAGQSGVANGRGAAARFVRPVGVAVAPDQSVYVVDEARTVRRVTAAGQVDPIATVPAAAVAVAVDTSGDLLVACENRRVYRVTPAGVVSVYVTSDVSLGGVAVTPQGRVWLLEYFTWTTPPVCCNAVPDGWNAIREVGENGQLTLVTTLDPVYSDGGLSSLVVDQGGVAYLMNHVNRRLERVAVDRTVTSWVRTAVQQTGFRVLASDVAGGVVGLGPPRAASQSTGQLKRVSAAGVIGAAQHTTRLASSAVVRQGDEHLFVDGPSIGRLSQSGAVSLFTTLPYGAYVLDLAAAPGGTSVALVGGQGWAYLVRVGVDGTATTLRTDMFGYGPLTVSPVTGDIYVVDKDKHAIRRYSADGSGGDVVAGQADAAASLVDGTGAAARFVYVARLRGAPDGSVYIVDGTPYVTPPGTWRGAYLRQLHTDGRVVSLWSSPGHELQDVEVSPTGEVFLLSDGAIYRVTRPASVPLVVVTPPAPTTVVAGGSATFTVAATGGPVPLVVWQESRDAGQTWTTMTTVYGAHEGDRLVLPYVTRQMHGYLYRASIAVADEATTTTPVALSVTGMSAAPGQLSFGVVRDRATGTVLFVTPPQDVQVSFTAGAPGWSVSTSVPWLSAAASVTAGAGTVQVSVVNIAGVSNSAVGAMTLTPTDGVSPALTIPVALTIGSNVPIGQVDTPVQGATGLQGAIAMTGWAVDDVGIQHVRIYRQCLLSDAPAACQTVVGESVVLLGTATQVSGSRPDVEALYPTYPAVTTAGWGFLILSNLLPNIPASTSSGGVGTFQLYAVATDVEGHTRLLGRSYVDTAPVPTTVTTANDNIAKPFGAIDTPAQGGVVVGGRNFGWVLTPDINTVADGSDVLVPTTGSTITVIIDGVPVGAATYNLCRGTVGNPVPSGTLCDDDVSGIFRGAGRFRNLDAGRGAIGYFQIPTSSLSNGLHTIQWGVTDSAGRSEGIGSRYFTVVNGAGDANGETSRWRDDEMSRWRDAGTSALRLFARTGFDLARGLTPVEAIDGVSTIRVPELGRVEIQVPGVTSGALLANGELRDLPVGMAINAETGTVTWSVGPGYLGTYRLGLIVDDGTSAPRHPGTSALRHLDIVVVPQALADEPVRMFVDRADVGGPALSERLVRVEGWALDPQAETGSGIGAVHVWATRSAEVPECRGAEVPGCRSAATPVFLGVADLGVARPDVAAAHGAPFGRAGWVFTGALEPGTWEVTAYVWNVRTQRFEDARTVQVVLK